MSRDTSEKFKGCLCKSRTHQYLSEGAEEECSLRGEKQLVGNEGTCNEWRRWSEKSIIPPHSTIEVKQAQSAQSWVGVQGKSEGESRPDVGPRRGLGLLI